jgi:aromatic amino acid aminotransferase I
MRENGYETPIVPSFLSLDVDGRVLRVDSFSKIVAPGSRSGWITGPAPLIEKIMNSREGSTVSAHWASHRHDTDDGLQQAPSGFTVAAISSVLRAWGGHEGFERNYLPHISGQLASLACTSV